MDKEFVQYANDGIESIQLAQIKKLEMLTEASYFQLKKEGFTHLSTSVRDYFIKIFPKRSDGMITIFLYGEIQNKKNYYERIYKQEVSEDNK